MVPLKALACDSTVILTGLSVVGFGIFTCRIVCGVLFKASHLKILN